MTKAFLFLAAAALPALQTIDATAQTSQSAVARGDCALAINANNGSTVTINGNCNSRSKNLIDSLLQRIEKLESANRSMDQNSRRILKLQSEQAAGIQDLASALHTIELNAATNGSDVFSRAAQFELEQGKVKLASELLGQKAKASIEKGSLLGRSAAAQYYREQGALLRAINTESALKAYQMSVAIEKSDFETLEISAQLAISLNQIYKASEYYTEMEKVSQDKISNAADPILPKLDLAWTHVLIGNVNSRLGDLPAARLNLEKSLEETTGDYWPKNRYRDFVRYSAELGIADIFMREGLPVEALKHYKNSLQLAPESRTFKNQYSIISLQSIASIELLLGHYEEAIESVGATKQLFSKLNNSNDEMLMANLDFLQGEILFAKEDFVGAAANYKSALGRSVVAEKNGPLDFELKRNQILAGSRLGDALSKFGSVSDALFYVSIAINSAKEIVSGDPQNTEAARDLAVTQVIQGNIFAKDNKLSDAVVLFRSSIDIFERLVNLDSSNLQWSRDLFISNFACGTALARMKNPESFFYLDRARVIAESINQKSPDSEDAQLNLANAYFQIAATPLTPTTFERRIDLLVRAQTLLAGIPNTRPGVARELKVSVDAQLNFFSKLQQIRYKKQE